MSQRNIGSEGRMDNVLELFDVKDVGVRLFEESAALLPGYNNIRAQELASSPRSPEVKAMLGDFSVYDSSGRNANATEMVSPQTNRAFAIRVAA
jgi:hypothetical protein